MLELLNEEKPLSPYNEAVNEARFVKTFGIVTVIASLLTCGPGVMLGVGFAVMGFGKSRYYRVLGLTTGILGILGFFFAPCFAAATIVLGIGIMMKAIFVMGVLEREGKDDEDWLPTRKRAWIGLVSSGLAILLGVIWLIYFSLILTGVIVPAGA